MTMHNSVQRDVRQFVIDNFLYGQVGELTDDQSFLEGGIIDSTGVLELVAFLEQKFSISVDDDELIPANLDSIHSITRFVDQKMEARRDRRAG